MRPPIATRHDQLSRFRQLGLRWNPFRLVEGCEKSDVYVPDLYDSIEQAVNVASSDAPFTQVLADSGCGKSTFLDTVADELARRNVLCDSHYLPRLVRARIAVPAADRTVLIIDESERLMPRNRRKLFRWTGHGRRLIVSAHRDLSAAFPGPTKTIALPQITVDGVHRLFAARLCWSNGREEQYSLTRSGATWLLKRCGTNLRIIEAVLYEVFQTAALGERLTIDTRLLEQVAGFATTRAQQEAAGDVNPRPFSPVRAAITEWSGRTAAWFLGRASRPDQVVRGLPK